MSEKTLAVTVVPVTPFQQNCSILVDTGTKTAMVVDPGGDVSKIADAVAKLGVSVSEIWLTHGHIDHAGGAAELASVLGDVPIVGPHRKDEFLLKDLASSGQRFGMLTARAVTPSRWLAEGDKLRLGGLEFSVLECPGHTPGSVVFFNAANRFALVGDTLFKGSVGRTDFPYGDPEGLISAIKAKLFALGDDVTFLPGHGPHGTIGAERSDNPFLGGA